MLYVPIVNTITEFLKDKSVKEQFDNPILSQRGSFQDITDGSVTKVMFYLMKSQML